MSKKKKKASSGKAPNNASPQAGWGKKPTQERSKARAQQRKERAAHKKAMLKREEELGVPFEQDGTFAFIADYTDSGVPFGITWEELGLEPFASQDDLMAAFSRYSVGLDDDDFDGADDNQQGSDDWEDPDGYPIDQEIHEPSLNIVLEDIDDIDIDELPF